jgi:hypothetical protein
MMQHRMMKSDRAKHVDLGGTSLLFKVRQWIKFEEELNPRFGDEVARLAHGEKLFSYIPELRGFEKFSQGRRVEELSDITPVSAVSARKRITWLLQRLRRSLSRGSPADSQKTA